MDHSTMSGMNMDGSKPSSTSSSSSSSTSSAMAMSMVFHSNSIDSLFSTQWTPKNGGQYAGTIIFLVFLGMAFRAIAAGKSALECHWRHKFANKQIVMTNNIGERVAVVDSDIKHMPWRTFVDIPRAIIQTVLAGISYLL